MTIANVPKNYSEPARFIVHPTDFSPQSEAAFAHALRLALTNKATLALLHVGENAEEDWDRFPSVRQTLQRWGLLDAGARRADVAKLGIRIEKIVISDSNVVDAINGYASTHPVDLLVLATAQRHGPARWLKPSTAEKTAQKTATPTLFVPADGRGCISPEDGRATLEQVLIPVDRQPPAGGAIERGLRAIAAFGNERSKLTLLHVGPEADFPNVHVPAGPWHVVRTARQGNPVSEILAAAEETMANLLIMVTKGEDGILDLLRGTTTERVLRSAPCPVLSVPAEF